MKRYLLFGLILITVQQVLATTSPPKFDLTKFFKQSIYTYELQIIYDTAVIDENYPTKNLTLLKIKCSFYLVDTTSVFADLNRKSTVPVSIKCQFILSDDQSTNAIVNIKKCTYRVKNVIHFEYDSSKNEGFYLIEIPIKNKLRRLLSAKTLKYFQGSLKYQENLTHRCILNVPYNSYN